MRSARPLTFLNRRDAGRRLAPRLSDLHLHLPIVLGLPRGGVPVAAEIASELGAPLDVFVARKVGAPGRPELGIGAVAEGLDELVVSQLADDLGVGPGLLTTLADQAYQEVQRQVACFRGGRPLPDLAGRDVVLVDDGLATGVTAEAALVALRRRQPSRIVLAVPVCAPRQVARLAPFADDVVCVQSPDDFVAVGLWYEDFSQITDQEVVDALMGGGLDSVG